MPSNEADLMRQYARLGAAARIKELEAERTAILQAFPDLRDGSVNTPTLDLARAPVRRRKPRLSAQARKAVSERMKRYWAEWRAKKKKR